MLHHIETTVHGRFLLERRSDERLLVGFHGYGETADVHLAELLRIPGGERWSVAAVQALHPFYRRTGEVVASWMTSLDREQAVADNIEYVNRVLDATGRPSRIVFCGFSQGVAMAWRALRCAPAAGLMALAGDVPPDIVSDPPPIPPVLLGRGSGEEWYSEEKLKKDLSFLEGRVPVTLCRFEGGHLWTDEFRSAAGTFLDRFA